MLTNLTPVVVSHFIFFYKCFFTITVNYLHNIQMKKEKEQQTRLATEIRNNTLQIKNISGRCFLVNRLKLCQSKKTLLEHAKTC